MYTYGCDPEVFFGGDHVIPAGVVFDLSNAPHLTRLSCGNAYVDGAAFELQPNWSSDPEVVVNNCREIMTFGQSLAQEYGTVVSIAPELPIDLDWCKRDPSLTVFGCDPDRSAWGDQFSPGKINAAKHPWRYGGCHLHIGIVEEPQFFDDENNIITMSKSLDRTVGLVSMILGEGKDTRRRQVYGRPGIYRQQIERMEYRTPSNAIFHPVWLEYLFNLAGHTISLCRSEGYEVFNSILPDNLLLDVYHSGAAKEVWDVVKTAFGLVEIPGNGGNW